MACEIGSQRNLTRVVPKLDQIAVSQTGTREASAVDRQTIAPHTAHIEDHELRIGRSLYECMMAMHVGILEPQIVFLIPADTHQLTGYAQAAPSGTIHVDPRVGQARQGGCIRSPARTQRIGLTRGPRVAKPTREEHRQRNERYNDQREEARHHGRRTFSTQS